MSNLHSAYLAGLFDGEGFISIRPQCSTRKLSSVTTQVGIGMTDRYIEKLYKRFGGSFTIEPAKDNHKEVYRWTLSRKADMKKFLEYIYPYLNIKKKQTRIMLNFIKIKTVSGRERTPTDIKLAKKYIEKIRKLNGKVKRMDIYQRRDV